MKLNLTFQKNITGFKPEVHWKIILSTTFALFLLSIGYTVYLYIYAKKQINLVSVTEATTTPAHLTTLSSPEKIQEYFKVYQDREVRYSEIIKFLMSANKPVVATPVATTGVATSTNQ